MRARRRELWATKKRSPRSAELKLSDSCSSSRHARNSFFKEAEPRSWPGFSLIETVPPFHADTFRKLLKQRPTDSITTLDLECSKKKNENHNSFAISNLRRIILKKKKKRKRKERREKKKLTDDKDEITASRSFLEIFLKASSPSSSSSSPWRSRHQGCLTTGGPPSPGRSGGSAFGFALLRACARPHRRKTGRVSPGV